MTHVRRGSVLVVVLVVIALLALGAYSFSEMMVSESQGTSVFGRETQARACADSGIELAAAMLGTPSEEGIHGNVHHAPQHFGGVTLRESDTPRGRARFSLVAPNESDLNNSTIRFGLIDESSKLNLNSLINDEKKQQQRQAVSGTSLSANPTGNTGPSGSNTSNSQTSSLSSTSTPEGRLMMIPGMTAELADAILDWLDDDDTPRTYGCESEYYQSLSPPYPAKNGPMDSLEELLLVRGVMPDLLYGEDANRNGLLDPNENDGDASWPLDNSDGTLQLGWSAYLTVFGRELNLRGDGSARLNINNNNLADLFDQLEQEFDTTTAQFVVAYRVSSNIQGQITGNNSPSGSASANAPGGSNSVARPGSTGLSPGVGTGSTGAASGTRSGSTGSSAAQSGSTGSSASQSSNPTQQLQQAASALGAVIGGGSGTVTRGGMDLSKVSGRQIQSLFELIGTEAQITLNGTLQTLQSPWTASGNDMIGYLPQLFDTLSTSNDQVIDGRININQARRETLLTIPNVTESLADAILAARQATDGQPLMDETGARATVGWLVIQNLVDLTTMASLDRYITARGGMYRVQSIGYFDEAGPFIRLEAVIDTTQNNKPPAVIFLQDLTELGRGYPAAMLRQQ